MTLPVSPATIAPFHAEASCVSNRTDGAARMRPGLCVVPEETAIAFVYGGTTAAVMMATPADLHDFAFGFSLTEGIARHPDDIEELAIVPCRHGIELRMWLAAGRDSAFRERRRRAAGPTGCGLCGIESLEAAMRPTGMVGEGARLSAAAVADALDGLCAAQTLHRRTRATHAAAFYVAGQGVLAIREDVGRHNALDKLAGAIARERLAAAAGAVVVTSRVSVEMVQKTVMTGAGILVAVSAPTALAVRLADAANLTLVALARGPAFEVFTHPRRIC